MTIYYNACFCNYGLSQWESCIGSVSPSNIMTVYHVHSCRVWEKMKESICSECHWPQEMDWHLGQGTKGLQNNRNVQFPSQAIPCGWSIANMLVFNKVQESLGFQWCAHLITGSVSITQEVLEHFMLVNLPVLEWVSVLVHTFQRPWAVKSWECWEADVWSPNEHWWPWWEGRGKGGWSLGLMIRCL